MAKAQKERKGKKKHTKHAEKPRYQQYEIKGEETERKNRFCPKCGPGIFLAEHKDRLSCGKCSYTEWKKK